MAKPTGFLEYKRQDVKKRPVDERVTDFREIEMPLPVEQIEQQAARCMDCGIPFCHAYGCPLRNLIPDWQDMVYRNQWRKALVFLHASNNFPEITGRICPAPCEAACALAISDHAVSIRQIELRIAEKGWREGWIVPEIASYKTGKKAAIIGSGSAGLAAAQELARKGHQVTVFERADRIGGILRYGIPDFKLEKWVIDRRLAQLEAEGVNFEVNVDMGRDISARYLQRTFNAILITAGSTKPRDLDIPGRDLRGIHYAMDYLIQQNRLNAGDGIPESERITAGGKQVVVIGGGDTGADCVGTARRQGAVSVSQIEILPKPGEERELRNPWPEWPRILRSGSSHEEGCERLWSVQIKEFCGVHHVESVVCAKLNWNEAPNGGKFQCSEISNSRFEKKADLVLLAMGFAHAEHGAIVNDTGIELDTQGNIVVDRDFKTSKEGFFAAGDAVSGASLIVRAIDQGRRAAAAIDRYLME